jgi:MYXO-CTERM domain-containing protein
VTDLRIVHNEFARLGFRDQEQGEAGLSFHQADHVLFEGNHVHDTAHNSVHFSQARPRSSKGYGLEAFMVSGSWIDQPVVLANNTFADSPNGLGVGTRNAYAPENTGYAVVNNLFLHNRRFAHSIGAPEILRGQVQIDYNLYHLNGYEPWPQHTPGIMAGDLTGSDYQELATLADVRSTVDQEAHGVQGDPLLAGYDPSIADGSWQDFRLTAKSARAIDQGTELPESLVALLDKFGLDPGQKGEALDLGAIEFDPEDPDAPFEIDVGPRDGDSTKASVPWTPAEDAGSSDAAKSDGATSDDEADKDQAGKKDEGCGCSLPGESPESRSSWWLVGLAAAALGRKAGSQGSRSGRVSRAS